MARKVIYYGTVRRPLCVADGLGCQLTESRKRAPASDASERSTAPRHSSPVRSVGHRMDRRR
jgi:hypothetical protein